MKEKQKSLITLQFCSFSLCEHAHIEQNKLSSYINVNGSGAFHALTQSMQLYLAQMCSQHQQVHKICHLFAYSFLYIKCTDGGKPHSQSLPGSHCAKIYTPRYSSYKPDIEYVFNTKASIPNPEHVMVIYLYSAFCRCGQSYASHL